MIEIHPPLLIFGSLSFVLCGAWFGWAVRHKIAKKQTLRFLEKNNSFQIGKYEALNRVMKKFEEYLEVEELEHGDFRLLSFGCERMEAAAYQRRVVELAYAIHKERLQLEKVMRHIGEKTFRDACEDHIQEEHGK